MARCCKPTESEQVIADRYRILEKLAQGNCGVVYRAQDARTEKQVALKLFTSQLVDDWADNGNLLLEARVAARAGSKHIVDVLDVGTDDATGRAFLVMEFLRGKDLDRLVREQGPRGFAEVVDYLLQAASALESAHACKDERGQLSPIIHRDLKPANLFLTEQDGKPLVKILDFGIAKLSAAGSLVSTEIKGTPAYIAPEQILREPVSPATDVWALGLVAFWLLTGRPFWKSGQPGGTNLNALFLEVLAALKDPPSLRSRELGFDGAFPHGFDEWFLRCVNRDPWCRFSRAGGAAAALAGLLDSAPGRALSYDQEALKSIGSDQLIANRFRNVARPASGGHWIDERVSGCVEREPSHRSPRAREAATEFAALLDSTNKGREIAGKDVGLRWRGAAWIAKGVAIVLGGGLAVAMLFGGLGPATERSRVTSIASNSELTIRTLERPREPPKYGTAPTPETTAYSSALSASSKQGKRTENARQAPILGDEQAQARVLATQHPVRAPNSKKAAAPAQDRTQTSDGSSAGSRHNEVPQGNDDVPVSIAPRPTQTKTTAGASDRVERAKRDFRFGWENER